MKQFAPRLVVIAAMLTVLSGCLGAVRTEPAPVKTEQELAQEQASHALQDALARYEEGDYQQAQQALLSDNVWQGDLPTRLSALKHLAYIYCMTEREQMCRHAFERAMHLDRNFVLSTAEAGHPLWGPQYRLALSGRQD